MGYSSKNPKFSSVILPDLAAAASTAAPASSHRIFDRNGALHLRGASGGDVIVGHGLVSAKSADYTLLDTDSIGTVAMTTSSTTRTVTLPTAADNTHRRITIKKVDSGTGFVIIDGEGSETVDGATTLTLYSQYDEATVQCDGSGWFVVERRVQNRWQRKFLASDKTGSGGNVTLSDMSFSNLVVGKVYRATFNFNGSFDSGDVAIVSMTHNGNVIGVARGGSSVAATSISGAFSATAVFTAAATTLTFVGSSFAGTSALVGNGTAAQTHAILEELNDFPAEGSAF